MSRAAQHAAVQTLARYQRALRTTTFAWVGSGEYGLVAILDDGDRILAFVGFDSAADAEIMGAFQLHHAQLVAMKADAQPAPRHIFEIIGLAEPRERPQPPKIVRYDVVALSPAVPADALDHLGGIT